MSLPGSDGSNPTLIVTVTDLSRGGNGVARDASGRVVFVPYSAPGDRLRVRVTQSDKRYCEAEIVEIIEASSVRQTPPCPVFGRCGGCKWQHIPYELQWRTKFEGVRHALSRVQVEWPTDTSRIDDLRAEQIWEYRNRVQLRGFGPEIGFLEPGSLRRVPIERCEIARAEINAAIPAVRAEGERFKQREYKVEVEVMPDGAIRQAWNQKHAAGGFRQVHDGQNEKLQSWVRDHLTPGRAVYDLYGGAGNLSRPLADQMTRIDCVDVSSPYRTPEGTPANLFFHRAPTLEWVSARAKQASGVVPAAASAILDPPRIGLGPDFSPIEQALRALGVNEVAAVGCDVDAWARDVSRFVRRGWRLERVGVLDLFPQTPHVESLALLRH